MLWWIKKKKRILLRLYLLSEISTLVYETVCISHFCHSLPERCPNTEFFLVCVFSYLNQEKLIHRKSTFHTVSYRDSMEHQETSSTKCCCKKYISTQKYVTLYVDDIEYKASICRDLALKLQINVKIIK